MVLTVRDGEPIPVGIQELWKVGEFDRIDLQPLSPDETTTLLSATLVGSVDPDAASRLWQLTRGNVLYLRHIVEQEVADGQLDKSIGYWQWIGDPIMPHGLVELIESRIGALPAAVGAVVDALAVGEPIELAALRRITDPDAVEEADIRGLISLDDIDSGVEVRVAHPLYGEVRRKRAAPTRLRRLRGLVATELAAGDDRDDVRVVVRRAALSLDSDLEPDADLLLQGGPGRDLSGGSRRWPIGWRKRRCAPAPDPKRSSSARMRCRGSARGREAEEVLADVPVTELTRRGARQVHVSAGEQHAVGAGRSRTGKEIIDDASHVITEGPARSCIDAVRTVYWFAIDRPDAATRDVAEPGVGRTARHRRRGDSMGAQRRFTPTPGRTSDAVAVAEAGYTVATRCSDAPHMRFNIADAHVGALLLSGRVGEALEVADANAGRRPISRARLQLLGAADRGPGRTWCRAVRHRMSGVGAGGGGAVRRGPCHGLGVPLPRPVGDGAGDARSTGGGGRGAWRHSTRCRVRSGRWTTRRAWRGRG